MKKLFLVSLMLTAGSAFAEWYFLVGSRGGHKHYFDPATIRKDGNMRTFWHKAEYMHRRKDGAFSVRQRLQIDCKKETIRVLAQATFPEPNFWGEAIKDEDTPNAPFIAIAPETVDHSFMLMMCQ
jgi:hypothetical protein